MFWQLGIFLHVKKYKKPRVSNNRQRSRGCHGKLVPFVCRAIAVRRERIVVAVPAGLSKASGGG